MILFSFMFDYFKYFLVQVFYETFCALEIFLAHHSYNEEWILFLLVDFIIFFMQPYFILNLKPKQFLQDTFVCLSFSNFGLVEYHVKNGKL
jgi:hypothetical protein